MEKTIEIPEGYEARIEGNKVILEPKESEDERIRTRLIALVEAFGQGTYKDEMLAYLEKQKEQRPVEDKDAIEPTPKQDYSGLTDFERAIHRGFLCAGVENVPVDIIKDTAQDCLAHIKPAEWSDAEKMHLANAILAAEKEWGVDSYTVKFLESLRPSPAGAAGGGFEE